MEGGRGEVGVGYGVSTALSFDPGGVEEGLGSVGVPITSKTGSDSRSITRCVELEDEDETGCDGGSAKAGRGSE